MITRRPTPRKPRRLVSFAGQPSSAPKAEPKPEPDAEPKPEPDAEPDMEEIELADEPPKRKGETK